MSAIKLSKKEWALIERYLKFYTDLATGTRIPSTPAQERFVEVSKGNMPPRTEHERAFRKWVFLEADRKSLQGRRVQRIPDPAARASTPKTVRKSTEDRIAANRIAPPPIESANEEQPVRSNEIIWPNRLDEEFWKLSDYEEGYPRTEFGTREEHLMMRGRQRSANKRGRHR